METRVRRVEVPQAIATASSPDNPPHQTYASAFALPLDGADLWPRSAEQWARAVFEGAPPLLRSCIIFGWRSFLGLRLQPLDAADQVLGWRLERKAPEAEPDGVLLAADSRRLRAQNIVAVDRTVVLWVTVVRFEGRAGRLLWGLASLVHHLTIPYLLARAARSGTDEPAGMATSTAQRQAMGAPANGHGDHPPQP